MVFCMALPSDFVDLMTPLLGEEAAPFFAALEADVPGRGLRVNTLKISAEDFAAISPFALTPSPLCPDAFVTEPDARLGLHAFHAAGLYYVQDPSASAAVEVLAPKPGEKILDLCAAPGGKSTHIAARLSDAPGSLLAANEIVPRRAKILSANLERIGAKNAVVCCASPEDFAAQCEGAFDAVLVDAPCSGEGMFRRDEQAVREYSLEHVKSCASRQGLILDSAAACVRPGGRLVYSTCTFNPYENEGVIDAFLSRHPDFSIAPIPFPALLPGRPEWAGADASLINAGRLMPHKCPGEGHFVCLLLRAGEGEAALLSAPREGTLGKRESADFASFWKENFISPIFGTPVLHGDLICLAPDSIPLPRVLRAGVCAARLAKRRIEPEHSLFLSLSKDEFAKKCVFSPDSPEIAAFLRGETLKIKNISGFAAVCAGSDSGAWALGFGKISGGILKNHYPKGLRFS